MSMFHQYIEVEHLKNIFSIFCNLQTMKRIFQKPSSPTFHATFLICRGACHTFFTYFCCWSQKLKTLIRWGWCWRKLSDSIKKESINMWQNESNHNERQTKPFSINQIQWNNKINCMNKQYLADHTMHSLFQQLLFFSQCFHK